MAKILILFGTNFGQTRKVANHIADIAIRRGHEVDLVQGNKAGNDFSTDTYGAAFIGTSIHMDTHQISMRRLVKEKRDEFRKIPTAYFCVCLTAYGTGPEDKNTKKVKEMLGITAQE